MTQSLNNLICLVCGGEVVVDESNKIATCKYCKHTFQIGSSLSDNGIINLTLANEYYKTFRFSDSKRKYLEVIAEDKTFSEAYWGAFISEYGIEWGENSFGDIVPTCHRAHTISVFDDKNYQLAIKYSNEESKQEYIELANKIEDVRNEIIAKSQNEANYDVFICFKATEEIDGRKRKTVDYDLGSEIYKKLTSNGYKVFFSPETLLKVKEQEFEPYIFKALNSAKVMLLLCSSNEKIESAWVKNEWGRFIDMHSGNGLIPVCGNRFENYNPASLPNELRKLNCIEYGVNLYDQILTKIETYFPEKLKEKEEAEKQKMFNMFRQLQEENQKQVDNNKKMDEQQRKIEELERQLEEAKHRRAKIKQEKNIDEVIDSIEKARVCREIGQEDYCDDFIIDNDILEKYIGNSNKVVIPFDVVTIKKFAFYNCRDIVSVAINNNVSTVCSYAFRDCISLIEIIIGSNIKKIEDGVFFNCSSLSRVYYEGTENQWNSLKIGGINGYLEHATRYYYSEIEPIEEGNYWHYDTDGKTIIEW